MPSREVVAQLRAMLRDGPRTSRELRRALGGVSQPEFWRAAKSLGDQAVQFGHKRTGVYYALTRAVAEAGRRWPLHVIDESGRATELGELMAIEPRGFVYRASREAPRWMSGQGGRGLFGGVPFFLDDLRPQGFLGRAAARRLSAALQLPQRLSDWQESHVMLALTRAGDDGPGDLIVGAASYETWMRRVLGPSDAVPAVVDDRLRAYEDLAERALRGEVAGSSAGGEQPKFTARIGDDRHVLVKFSRRGTPAEDRWADLLECEHLAHDVARESGLATVQSLIFRTERHVFLETSRFDRIGRLGRRAALSLLALDAEFFGALDTWPAAAKRLQARRWLADPDVAALSFAWLYSAFVANTDRHFGNITLLPAGETFSLAPLYDIVPMIFAPQGAAIVERRFEVPVPPAGGFDEWARAGRAGLRFWERVAAQPSITADFRRSAASCAESIQDALRRLGAS
jgi:hypothetical protein